MSAEIGNNAVISNSTGLQKTTDIDTSAWLKKADADNGNNQARKINSIFTETAAYQG